MNNLLIRQEAKRSGVALWEVAEALGVADSTLYRQKSRRKLWRQFGLLRPRKGRSNMANSKAAAPFQKIPDACKTTGLSQYFLRKGCKDGSVPHIKSGPTYYVNIPALLEQLGVPPQTEASAAPGR